MADPQVVDRPDQSPPTAAAPAEPPPGSGRRRPRPAVVLTAGVVAVSAALILGGMRSAGAPSDTTEATTQMFAAPAEAPTPNSEPARELAAEGEFGTSLAIDAAQMLAAGTTAGLDGADEAAAAAGVDISDEAGLAVALAAGFSTFEPAAAADPDLPIPAAAPTVPYFDEPIVDIGRITIPSIGVDRTLHQGISLHNIDRGPSHWPGTAGPGEIGNVVIAGHRTTHGAPFRNIDLLEPGDEVILTAAGVRHTYVVVGDEVVTPDGLHIVEQTPESTATLFACHPPGSAAYRFVVHLALDSSETSIPTMMR